MLLFLAAGLVLLVGLAHSYLGERYILIRLFRRSDLPHLFGSDVFTRRTLRFAWHLTTVAWWGLSLYIRCSHVSWFTGTTSRLVGVPRHRASQLAWHPLIERYSPRLFQSNTGSGARKGEGKDGTLAVDAFSAPG